jgi:RNA polymerase sigma-70 factor (ECF subfamily)
MELEDAIERFRGPLIGLVLSWGAPAVDAFEIAQDCIADGFLSRDACRGDVSEPLVFGRWLRGIARNKYLNWARSRSRRERRVQLATPETLAETATDTEQQETVDPRLERLRSEIERLPRKQREVVLMHYLEETSVADVAAILSVTPKAVEGRLYQARRRLRQRLDATPSNLQIFKAILL